jgi:hypothetical protein
MRSRNHRGSILMSRELNSLKEALDSRRVKIVKKVTKVTRKALLL